MTLTKICFFICLLIFIGACSQDAEVVIVDPCIDNPDCNFELIEYEESFEDFANPERGFYKYSETSSSNYEVLSASRLASFRDSNRGSRAQYSTYNTLVFRYYVLDEYRNSGIEAEFLANMQVDFDAAREAGVKLIPRICYNIRPEGGDCPEDFICPPYLDAPKNIVLMHIEQLAPVLNANVDVILCLQLGFIGTWGENYYTDYFGDASSNGIEQKLVDDNWIDRIEVLESLLEKLDQDIMVQVRYPQMKQRTIYGVESLTNVAPLTASEAFTGSNKARIGFHNDCLFANFNDFGTYEDYGNSSSIRRADVGTLKPYFQEDGRFVYVGGETCFDGYNPQSNCSPEGLADTELRALHYTYLNTDYNNDVNNDWVEGGCMDAIKLNLGYRYVLRSGKYEKILSEDRVFDLEMELENVGYATVLKNRPVMLILKNTETGAIHQFALESDMRSWESSVSIQASLSLNSDIVNGTYEGSLFLPDSESSISSRPEYAIRLGSVTAWDETTGYNDLEFTLTVEL